MNETRNKEIDRTIDKLLEVDHEAVTAPILKLALEQHRKEQEELAGKRALQYLQHVESIVKEHVSRLRNIRKQERDAKSALANVVAARDEFHKTGNYEQFCKAISDDRVVYLHKL